ncbi:MAG: non-heme iron oxygenase ferredoxin subunit [Pirellulales bacterium]
MSDFLPACKVSDLGDGERRLVEIDDRIVVLFRVGESYYAIDDVCTHDGGPLSEGTLEDFRIACPRHGAQFDIRDGRALTMPATRATAAHETKVDNDMVYVRLADD